MDENKRAHLGMIQTIVSRMASESAAAKKYCLTVTGVGLAAIATLTDKNFSYYGFIILMITAFWALDAKYLQQEKWFRKIYNKVTLKKESEIDFNLDPNKETKSSVTHFSCMMRWPTVCFYAPLTVASLLIGFAS